MGRYHFHTQDGRCLSDEEGTELDDIAAAKRVAVQHLVETLHHNSCMFWDTDSFSVIVTDDTGLTLFVLELGVTVAAALAGRDKRTEGATA